MSNHSRVRTQFLVTIFPMASKNCTIMNSDWTNVRTYVHICTTFVPNILWPSLIHSLPGKHWQTDMIERICSHVCCNIYTWRMHMFACVWLNTFVKCMHGLSGTLLVSAFLRTKQFRYVSVDWQTLYNKKGFRQNSSKLKIWMIISFQKFHCGFSHPSTLVLPKNAPKGNWSVLSTSYKVYNRLRRRVK